MKLLGAERREILRRTFERAGVLHLWELLISDVDEAVQNERTAAQTARAAAEVEAERATEVAEQRLSA